MHVPTLIVQLTHPEVTDVIETASCFLHQFSFRLYVQSMSQSLVQFDLSSLSLQPVQQVRQIEELVESTEAQFDGFVDPVELVVLLTVQLDPESVNPVVQAVQVDEYPDAEEMAVFEQVEQFLTFVAVSQRLQIF